MTLSRESIVKHLKNKKIQINIYPSNGRVYSISDFVNLHIEKVSFYEKNILKESKHLTNTFPPLFKMPFSLAKFLRRDKLKPLQCKRSGARSAFLIKEGFKLKGCNPKINVFFPVVKYKFGSNKAIIGKINFGVLSSENVLREILAYCFFKLNDINISHKPICVFEYLHKGKSLGFCLVTKNETDNRTEGLMEYNNLSIKDLIRIKYFEKRFNLQVLSGEIKFKGINGAWYAKQKANLLLNVNFNGGFRGILNSNLGNDILHKKKLFICDFDTFTVINIPHKPDFNFIKSFCSWCFVEMLKAAIPVWDYIDLTKKSKKEATKLLQESLNTNSLFLKHYKEGFIYKTMKLGWDIKKVNKAIEEVSKTNIYYELLSELVINSKTLIESYEPKLGIYALHN